MTGGRGIVTAQRHPYGVFEEEKVEPQRGQIGGGILEDA